MSYKIDKRRSSDVQLKDLPDVGKEGSPTGIYADSQVIREILGRDGLNVVGGFEGVTGVFVTSTENGEHEGVYVTYGSFYADVYVSYHPVIEYKRKGRRINYNKSLTTAELCHKNNGMSLSVITGYDLVKALRGIQWVSGNAKTMGTVVNGVTYVSDAKMVFNAIWYPIETYEY